MSSNRNICDTCLFVTPQQSPAVVSPHTAASLSGIAEYPSLPALSDRLLRLELCLSAFVTDLKDITNIIRSDVGLTIQLLRLAAREIHEPAAKVLTVNEIVLHVGIDRVKRLVARTNPLSSHFHGGAASSAAKRFWMHSRLIALVAEELASQSAVVSHEEAYLAGLLFHIGELPLLLSWIPSANGADPRHAGYRMAKAWGFPRALVDVIAGDRELCLPKSRVLLDIVAAAGTWAARLEVLATGELRRPQSGIRPTH